MNARALIALVLSVVVSACADANDSLDVSTATAVLGRHIASVRPFFHFQNGMAAEDDPGEGAIYAVLARAGVLRVYRAPSILQSTPQTHYRLTAAGLRLARHWRKTDGGVYEVPIGKLRLDRVIGVQMLAPRHAIVSYTYATDFNALGRQLHGAGRSDLYYFDRLNSRMRPLNEATRPTADSAELALYDGWWQSESWSP